MLMIEKLVENRSASANANNENASKCRSTQAKSTLVRREPAARELSRRTVAISKTLRRYSSGKTSIAAP
jgi:hypothetical protein